MSLRAPEPFMPPNTNTSVPLTNPPCAARLEGFTDFTLAQDQELLSRLRMCRSSKKELPDIPPWRKRRLPTATMRWPCLGFGASPTSLSTDQRRSVISNAYAFLSETGSAPLSPPPYTISLSPIQAPLWKVRAGGTVPVGSKVLQVLVVRSNSWTSFRFPLQSAPPNT